MEITTLKKSCQFFISISKNGDLMPGSKSDLVHCLEKFNKEATTDNMTMYCIILDGAAIVNMIKVIGVKSFQQYATQNFTSYIKKKLEGSEWVDIVWDVYVENFLKSSARHKRGNINWKGARVSTIIIIKKKLMFPLYFVGKGIPWRVLSTTKIPGNWQSFLNLDGNNGELFGFLANEVTKEETEKLIISTIGSSVIMNRSFDNVSTLSPSNH